MRKEKNRRTGDFADVDKKVSEERPYATEEWELTAVTSL